MGVSHWDETTGGVIALCFEQPTGAVAVFARTKIPFKFDVVAVYCSNINTAVPTVDVKAGGTTVLASMPALTTATTQKGVMTATSANRNALAAETELTFETLTAGTGATSIAITVFIKRREDDTAVLTQA
jgi:hypothetical protein